MDPIGKLLPGRRQQFGNQGVEGAFDSLLGGDLLLEGLLQNRLLPLQDPRFHEVLFEHFFRFSLEERLEGIQRFPSLSGPVQLLGDQGLEGLQQRREGGLDAQEDPPVTPFPEEERAVPQVEVAV